MFYFPLTTNGAISNENISIMNEWNSDFPSVSSYPTNNPFHVFKSYLMVKLQDPLPNTILLRCSGYSDPSDFSTYLFCPR